MASNEKIIALVINALTGEETARPMTIEELSERNQMQLKEAQGQTEKEAKDAARKSALAKLAALGLTEEEIGAL
jgi:hypothetical protein